MAAVICFGSLIDKVDSEQALIKLLHPPAIPDDAPELMAEGLLDPSCRLLRIKFSCFILVANGTVHEVEEGDEPLGFLPFNLFRMTQKNSTLARIRYYHKLCGFTIFHDPQWFLGVR